MCISTRTTYMHTNYLSILKIISYMYISLMYICMHICVFICMHVYLYACVHACKYTRVTVCMYHACIHTCMYVYVTYFRARVGGEGQYSNHVGPHVTWSMYVCMYVCAYVLIHIARTRTCLCIHVYVAYVTYMYIYIYTHTHTDKHATCICTRAFACRRYQWRVKCTRIMHDIHACYE
jgi:hypothetical protein